MQKVGVGKIFVDSKGAGRLYIPKKFMRNLPFENGEQIKLTFKDGILIIEKL
jgi:antitoxin component of MazEF toxin-antitoxin module